MKVAFTGGGTAGHAVVNTTLIPFIQQEKIETIYIGSKNGIERNMIHSMKNVNYFAIQSGKLRRYFSLKNVTDIFRILIAFFQAYKILGKEKVSLVYSSGGYVAVPVVWAAYLQGIPVILRETDYSIGLANRLCIPCSKDLFVTFFETDGTDYEITLHNKGMIIRPELLREDKVVSPIASEEKPVCLIIGGSSGAEKLNFAIWKNLSELTEKYSIIHITGKGKMNKRIENTYNYQQVEFINQMGPCYAKADIVITRSGSNAIAECLLLGKRMICVPLSSTQSRGEQTLNAEFAQKYGNAVIVDNNELTKETLLLALSEIKNQPLNDLYKIEEEELIERINEHVRFIKHKMLKISCNINI